VYFSFTPLADLSAPLTFAHSAVRHRQERIERFEHDDFRTQATPHAAQLEADHAGADHAQTLRHGVEFERAPRVDDLLAVERQALQFRRSGTSREDHVLGGQLFLLAVLVRVLDTIAAEQLAVALEAGHTGGFEQRGNALR
jgi:hypothetical protein